MSIQGPGIKVASSGSLVGFVLPIPTREPTKDFIKLTIQLPTVFFGVFLPVVSEA